MPQQSVIFITLGSSRTVFQRNDNGRKMVMYSGTALKAEEHPMVTPGQVWRERRRNRFVRVMTIYDPAIIVVRGCNEEGQISIPTNRSRIRRERFEHDFCLHRDRQPSPNDGYWWAYVKERDEPCVIVIDDGDAREVCQEVVLRAEQYRLMLKIDPPPPIGP